MKYTHIVFDIDGTLLDTEKALLLSLQQVVLTLQNRYVELDDLRFSLGITGTDALQKLGFADVHSASTLWNDLFRNHVSLIHVFDGIVDVLGQLKSQSYSLGIITSKTRVEYQDNFVPFGLDKYFDIVVCADDSTHHKPDPEPICQYLKRADAKQQEVLYIGDSVYDMACAQSANVDCALALWGCKNPEGIPATYYFEIPDDIVRVLGKRRDEPWLDWAIELQFIAQAGLTYSRDPFDLQRFERIREISAEIMSAKSGLTLDRVRDLFCNETGFQTPKVDCRAVIFREDKILLVKERIENEWSLPGGWVDVNQSIRSNIIKETREEAGLDVIPERLIAVQDRNKHNHPVLAYGVFKVFVLCRILNGEFKPNLEISESAFFSLENLPPLSLTRNSEEQIRMCFQAHKNENWPVLFD
jgi:phosphoglycolate phosphatase-like HAD superfamily hydrolase/ADP-ribose pyrophosphatase YjhB (NUDIX family)